MSPSASPPSPPPGDASGPIFAPDLLAGRVALVTGGGSGIGLGISRCLARAGAAVALASRNAERLEKAAARLRERWGARTLTLALDVRDPEALREAAARVAGELGSLDILVNNAAGNFYASSESLSANAWRAVVEIDLFGTFYGCQAAFPIMKDQGYGRIVSTSMTLHYRGWPRMAHATAAKAGVDALTRTLALEWARHGITVNAVAPGPIPTEGVRKAFADPEAGAPDLFGGASGGTGGGGDSGGGASGSGAGSGDEVGGGGAGDSAKDAGGSTAGSRAAAAYAAQFIPAGRLGTPDDIGHMVTYLVSPAGDWITGAIFVVDGGESLASPRVIARTPEPT